MKIVTKRLKVIVMTEEEIRSFKATMEKAQSGHTSHYAEERLSDGSFLGVQMVDAHEPKPPQTKRWDDPRNPAKY